MEKGSVASYLGDTRVKVRKVLCFLLIAELYYGDVPYKISRASYGIQHFLLFNLRILFPPSGDTVCPVKIHVENCLFS